MQHSTAVLSAWYIGGQVVYFLKRLDLAVNSKLNGTNTVTQYFLAHRRAIITRWFIATLGFLTWLEKPEVITGLLAAVGVSITLPPLIDATAGAYGFAAEFLLDWLSAKFPALQKEIPPGD